MGLNRNPRWPRVTQVETSVTNAADMTRAVSIKPAMGLHAKTLEVIAVTLGSLLAGAIYTWFVGEDVNWDWQNYHEYNVWALLNGRYVIDALPAGFQTYFNPTVYFPIYYLRHLLPLPVGLMIIGAVHGLNLLLTYFLARVLLGQSATVSAIGAAVLIAAVGPMKIGRAHV